MTLRWLQWLLPLLLLISAIGGVLLGSLELDQVLGSPFIINELRLSRVMLAMLSGAGLGLSGALIQSVVRNPLASPDLLGVTAGAGLAATSVMLLFPQLSFAWLIPAAILGALLSLGLLLLLIRDRSGLNPGRLVLLGIALSIWLGALTDWLLVSHPQQINGALVWLTGSLWGRSWIHVWVLLPWLLVLLPLTLLLAMRLDLLALGDEAAESLGAAVQRTRLAALLLSVALAAVSVAVCGAISFVGLIAPHMARLIVGGHHHRLIPAAAMIGALLVLLADISARTLAAPVELPAGVLTSLIGAPYFLFLLTRYRGW